MFLYFFQQTQILDLSNNFFDTIPEGLSGIPYLEKLNFSGNKIRTISSTALTGLTSLVTLDLSKNSISKWEDISASTFLLPATSLKKLYLSKNPLSDFSYPKSNQILVSNSLEELYLNKCNITDIYGKSPIYGLAQLRNLSMTHNPIKTLQRLVSKTLSFLDLSHCELTYIGHEELNYLPSLWYLKMSHNYRFSLNDVDVITSESLRKIDLSYCNMDKASLSGFHNLEEANLRGNMFRRLMSGDFTNNVNLVTLDLSSNAIAFIHKNAFEGLTALKTLNLSVNVIPTINEETFLKTPNLTVLYLSRNYISSVGSLKSKSVLLVDMSSCEVQIIDSNSLEGLSSILEINLSKNLISALPNALFSNSLQRLDLSFNRLSSIDNYTFSLLPELTTLYLSENRFTQTFKSYNFVQNSKLTSITLNDNTWRCDCTDEDMKYFFQYLSDEPPKVWQTNQLICHTPSNLSGRSWLEACYFTWYPEVSSLSPNQRAYTVVLMVIAGFFVTCFIILLIRHGIKMKERALEQEREREAEAARDRLREARMRREQLQQINAPDPRDTVSPPSYAEALLMPKLAGSFHSLSGVGVSQDLEKKPRRRARRRTRSSGDLLNEEKNSSRIRHRRCRSRTDRSEDPDSETPTEESRLTTHRSDGNIVASCVVQMHESDF